MRWRPWPRACAGSGSGSPLWWTYDFFASASAVNVPMTLPVNTVNTVFLSGMFAWGKTGFAPVRVNFHWKLRSRERKCLPALTIGPNNPVSSRPASSQSAGGEGAEFTRQSGSPGMVPLQSSLPSSFFLLPSSFFILPSILIYYLSILKAYMPKHAYHCEVAKTDMRSWGGVHGTVQAAFPHTPSAVPGSSTGKLLSLTGWLFSAWKRCC
jgi:hypothetical protein